MSHIQSKALFPVSLSNNVFSTEIVVSAISKVPYNYDEIVFLVADKLQIFNHISREIVQSARTDTISSELFEFSELEQKVVETSRQRRRWLDRIKIALDQVSITRAWNIIDIETLCDNKGFEILRRVLILYDLDKDFRQDVDDWAQSFVEKRYKAVVYNLQRDICRMSVRYILEEAALSIRARVIEPIADEYYIGRTTCPVAKIYGGHYSKTPWELAGVPKIDMQFAFFEYATNEAGTAEWRRVYENG